MLGLLLWAAGARAQSLNGSWFGVGTVAVTGDYSNYLAELKLKQKGNKVSGELQYYFRDSLFTVPLSGVFNSQTRQLRISRIPFPYYRSTNTRTAIDCWMEGQFTLITSRQESVLNGRFTSEAAYRYTVPDIQFRFRFSTDTLPAVVKETPELPADTMAIETNALKHATEQMRQLRPENLSPVYLSRPKTYVQEIMITNPSIRLELYDNGSIDYDSVSLYLNDSMILPKSKLDHKAIRLNITLDDSREEHELSMFAENLGMIPPNTAALILYDGTTRHELILTSDLNKTATIRLRRRKL